MYLLVHRRAYMYELESDRSTPSGAPRRGLGIPAVLKGISECGEMKKSAPPHCLACLRRTWSSLTVSSVSAPQIVDILGVTRGVSYRALIAAWSKFWT